VKLTELADDLVRQCQVIVAIAQDERFADALFEPTLFVNGVADIEQA